MSDESVREVTESEVAFFHKNGWVHLPSLVNSAVATAMLLTARSAPRPRRGAGGKIGFREAQFSDYQGLAAAEETYREYVFSSVMARNASRLLHGDKQVRLLFEGLLVKDPVGELDGHGPSLYHQDFPYTPVDRTSIVTFWLALADIHAAMGSMRFYSGSHRYGPLGMHLMDGVDLVDREPWLRELELSAPLNLSPGDATVHSDLVVHGAPPNTASSPRWAYSVGYFDAAARYTGQPFGDIDNLNLKYNEPFDHPQFPIISQAHANPHPG